MGSRMGDSAIGCLDLTESFFLQWLKTGLMTLSRSRSCPGSYLEVWTLILRVFLLVLVVGPGCLLQASTLYRVYDYRKFWVYKDSKSGVHRHGPCHGVGTLCEDPHELLSAFPVNQKDMDPV